jgi:NAD(P) transhydrogenase subunit alpha
MDKIPRISRAQKMDALSSMSNVSGYRAVIEAAHHFGSFFTGQITAAGKVPPAKVLIVGAGVAGLAALGAARSLGAIVRAFDVRPTVKDQVRSLGGEFLEVEMEESGDGGGGYAKTMSEEYHTAQMALFLEQAKEVDIVITTALIPGRTAPILWEKRAVEAMKPGSVVVDLAAIQGGNCEVTESGRTIKHNGVTVIGETDLTSRLPTVCSQLYGQNLVHLLTDMCASGEYTVDLEDEVVRGSIVLQEGERLPPPPKPEPSPPPKVEAEPEPAAAPVAAAAATPAEETSSEGGFGLSGLIGVALIGVWCWLRFTDMSMGPETNEFLQHLTVFALAVFVGWQVVWSVSAALHTPLMSVTNAISGIIIVGGLLQANQGAGVLALYLGVAAVFFATINISGGFLVTKRMLKMFRK